MSFYDNRYYYLNKTFLSIIGQWPFQSRLEGNVMFAITLLLTCSVTALQFWGLITGITNPNIFMENTQPLLVDSLIFIKLINFLCNKYKIKDLLEHIEETWKMMQVGPENKILRNYAEEGRSLTIRYATWFFYCTMPVIVSGVYLFLPTNKTYTPRFLFRVEHIIDMNKYFTILMLHSFVAIFFLLSILISIDSMFIICIQYLCALFANIQYHMERIGNSDFVILKPNIADDEAYHIIIHCIKSYNRALKYSDLLSSTYATSFLFMLGNVVTCMSFSAAELILMDIQFDEIIRLLSCGIGQVVHIFYLCLMSQRLTDHSSEMHEIIYSCNWYKISLRSRQLLRFMLLRATKPCQIKAGKMYVMSMENFSAILRVSASYFTVLTSVN